MGNRLANYAPKLFADIKNQRRHLVENDEDEISASRYYCPDCGGYAPLTFPRRSPFNEPNEFGIHIVGVILPTNECERCKTDDFFLSGTPGIQIVLSLRERFRNGELTREEFTYLEEEALAELLQVKFDDISIPKDVEAEVLAYLASLDTDSSLVMKSVIGNRPNLNESAFVPTSYVFRNWDPHTHEVTFKVDLFDIILMFRNEVPRPLTAMWRCYLELWARRTGVFVRLPW
jgi:hypothetical protein